MSYHVFLIPCHVSPLKSCIEFITGDSYLFNVSYISGQENTVLKICHSYTPYTAYDILCGVFHKVGLRDKTEIIPTECFFYRTINTLCGG